MLNIVDHLVSIFGSQDAVAKAAGCSQPSVAEWKGRNSVPTARARRLLMVAKEQGLPLKADDFLAVSTEEAA